MFYTTVSQMKPNHDCDIVFWGDKLVLGKPEMFEMFIEFDN